MMGTFTVMRMVGGRKRKVQRPAVRQTTMRFPPGLMSIKLSSIAPKKISGKRCTENGSRQQRRKGGEKPSLATFRVRELRSALQRAISGAVSLPLTTMMDGRALISSQTIWLCLFIHINELNNWRDDGLLG